MNGCTAYWHRRGSPSPYLALISNSREDGHLPDHFNDDN